ncbi:MAG: RNA methyltransferase [Pseudarcicella sp.]|jgi:TrmH family RNA methyltransferase|nr:RNA methyltransferase [Pseudarcicella sp.]MBP6410846.1 RNA methyltransferase [Pseudarcicella sp.]
MLSKNESKFIQSLQNKKIRHETQLFTVEGAKSVVELLDSDFKIKELLSTEVFYKENQSILEKQSFSIKIVSEADLSRAGTFLTNNAALAVVHCKENTKIEATSKELVLVLDDIRDPGNLGTIIRIADWYGITKLICSENTVEFYNPKVIAATMGSFCRVNVYYTNLLSFFEVNSQFSVFGAFLNGNSVHSMVEKQSGYIVMGNESKGISADLEKYITHKITIPAFGKAESLNVGVATAIICDNFKRCSS